MHMLFLMLPGLRLPYHSAGCYFVKHLAAQKIGPFLCILFWNAWDCRWCWLRTPPLTSYFLWQLMVVMYQKTYWKDVWESQSLFSCRDSQTKRQKPLVKSNKAAKQENQPRGLEVEQHKESRVPDILKEDKRL